MKAISLFLLGSLFAVFSADTFSTDKIDPAAAGMSSQRLAGIPARLQEFVDTNKVAGLVTLVARHGYIAQIDAVGYRDLEDKAPMKMDTIFRMMSMTKPITCAGMMVLVDEGNLSLLDPVEKFVPEFKGLKVNPCGTSVGYNCEPLAPTRPMTVLDLMVHMSGLGDGFRGAGRGGRRHPPPRAK